MIAELRTDDPEKGFDGKSWIERLSDVRSVRVKLCHYDGGTYPRVTINRPNTHSSYGMHEDGPYEVELFSDHVHKSRSRTSVCGPDESWVRGVIPRELLNDVGEYVDRYETEEDTTSEIIESALRAYVNDD